MTTRREIDTMLRALDPESPYRSTPEERAELIGRLTTASVGSEADVPDADLRSVRPVRSRRRRTVVIAVVAAAVVAVAGGMLVRERSTGVAVPAGGPTASALEPVDQATIDDAERLVLTSNPSAQGRLISCEGFTFPAWRLALRGGAERGVSAEAAGLRAFLAEPQNGMSPQRGGNWVVLAEDSGKVLFGQREGALGVGSAVVLADDGGTWTFYGSGGCGGGLIPAPGDEAQVVDAVKVAGRTLRVDWMGGSDGCSTTVVKRVETRQAADGLHLLVVTHSHSTLPPDSGEVACAGVGIEKHEKVSLPTSVGGERIFDDASVPSRPVELAR